MTTHPDTRRGPAASDAADQAAQPLVTSTPQQAITAYFQERLRTTDLPQSESWTLLPLSGSGPDIPPRPSPRDPRGYLALDAGAAICAADSIRKHCLFFHNPYDDADFVDAGDSSISYEGLHYALCNARKIFTPTAALTRQLQKHHGEPIHHAVVPALAWKRTPERARSILLITEKQDITLASQVEHAIASRFSNTFEIAIAQPGEALDQGLRQALLGDAFDAEISRLNPVGYQAHLYIGHASMDMDRPRMPDSWINGIPVLQLIAHGNAMTPHKHAKAEQGGTGLVATTLPELMDNIEIIFDDRNYAGHLTNRARAICALDTSSWQAYVDMLLAD